MTKWWGLLVMLQLPLPVYFGIRFTDGQQDQSPRNYFFVLLRMSKVCSACKQEKETDQFHKNKTHKDGLANNCKECQCSHGKTHKKKNPGYYDKVRESNRLRHTRMVNDIKIQTGCKNCHERHPACLDFHHRDPTQKRFTIAAGVSGLYRTEVILEEIKKCDVMCSNCHRKLSWDEEKQAWKKVMGKHVSKSMKLITGFALVIALAGCSTQRGFPPVHGIANFDRVDYTRLYRSAQPTQEGIAYLHDVVGIKSVINLRQPSDTAPWEAYAISPYRDMVYTNIPLSGVSAPTKAQMEAVM